MPENLVTSKNIGEFLFYQTEDGLTRINVKVVNKNVWLLCRNFVIVCLVMMNGSGYAPEPFSFNLKS